MIWIFWLFLFTLSRKKAVEGSNTPFSCLQPPIPPPSLCWSEHLLHVQIKTGFIWHYLLIYFLLSWQCWQTMGQGYSFIWHCELLLDHITPNELQIYSKREMLSKEVLMSFWEVPLWQRVHTWQPFCDKHTTKILWSWWTQIFHILCRSCSWSCLKIQNLFSSCRSKQTHLSFNEDFLHFQGLIYLAVFPHFWRLSYVRKR